ncbi:biopolymer transporter ExbD [Pararhodobacter sp.]|uniref:biopolymer transporter ExbD n=1 Tax=Pararhodobacter sp. TaxID=2127056 RepID=UPI002FDD0E7E
MPETGRSLVPPRRRSVLSLTSLIDVIFLLLLFFMLSSTFSRQGEVELAAAGGGAGAGTARPVFLQLGPEDLTLNATPVTLEELDAALAALAAAAGEGAEQEPALLLVALRPEVTAQRLIDLLGALRQSAYRVQVLS